MRCNNCGSEIMPGSQYCQVCGTPSPTFQQTQQPMQGGAQQGMYQQPVQGGMQQGMYQQSYQQPYSPQNQAVSYEDAGWGLKILSILIPIAGLILWLVKKDKEPVAAKTCLLWACVGVAINIFLGFLI
ncbi:MAG: hypothetical protein K2K45_06850 [Muribaculaceae bacterium]|nr:hypothetical protein [Muribaculaceae bacterium]